MMLMRSTRWLILMDEVTTETIYDGSMLCPKCGKAMTPLEVMYTDGKMCPWCRNDNYGVHMKRRMSKDDGR